MTRKDEIQRRLANWLGIKKVRVWPTAFNWATIKGDITDTIRMYDYTNIEIGVADGERVVIDRSGKKAYTF